MTPTTLEHAAGQVAGLETATESPLAHGGLRLTKLTMAGFKSFADKSTFTFDDAITGIVGPNGCGKSNVVDAIKWVLGERSSKSLRGKEMIDVIFAGSAVRKPAGMAAVSLTFENPKIEGYEPEPVDLEPVSISPAPEPEEAEPTGSESEEEHTELEERPTGADEIHAAEEGVSEAAEIIAQRRRIARPLPIDTDSVEVERRLYRDGKSQYLVNGRIARLKDIRDLFLDTGIGADAYSIIEQGKVDRMLLASPTERRAIFEEAAGIAKYRQRRVESERKLEKTETNLVRTREQLDNTERRLRMVRGQASKARRFQELDVEYRGLRLALAFDGYDDIRQRLDGLTSRLRDLESSRRESEESLREAEDARNDVEGNRHTAASRLREVEDQINAAVHEGESATQRADLTRRSIEDAQRVVQTETGRLEQAELRRHELDQTLAARREAVADLDDRLRQLEEALDQASADKSDAAQRAVNLRRELDDARASCASMEREHAGMLARAQSETQRASALQDQVAELDERIASITGSQHEAASRKHSIAAQLSNVEQVRDRAQQELETIQQRLESLGADRGTRAGAVRELDEQRVRLDARRTALEEMITSHEGLGDAAKAVLNRRDEDAGFAGVIAPLAGLIAVEPEHAEAVEAALGASLDALVVRSLNQMPSRGELEELPGRVTFLPLEGGSRFELNDIVGLDPVIGTRAQRIRSLASASTGDPTTDAQIEALLGRVLGNALLVDDLDAALLLAAGPLRAGQVRFITRDGVVMEPDGRIAAGPRGASESAGLIGRRSELSALESELGSITAQLRTATAALDAVDADAARVEQERARLAASVSEADQSVVKLGHELDRAVTESERLARDILETAGDRDRLGERISQARSSCAEVTEKASSLERLIQEQDTERERISDDLVTAESQHNEAAERAASARADVSGAHERARSAHRELGTLEAAAEDASKAAQEARSHIEQAQATLSTRTESLQEAEQAVEEAGERAKELCSHAESHRAELTEADDHLREASSLVQQARTRAETVQRDWHAIESSRRELEVKREHAEERSLDELGVNLAGDYFEYRGVMVDGIINRIDSRECGARAKVLKDEIKRLGPVNVGAIDEESQLAERNEDLIAQVRDIDETRIRLATLIEKLNIASREQFGEIFERIREEFGGRDGMFRKLFGGGKAEVRLMPLVKQDADGNKIITDEIDLLESGVEVIAKPPGKEPRSISQLSGGEKTMTAVALLLAIFRSKPSCFCILDEVDAALDEANVGRFCATIHEFTQFSHFIVITHNKRTMQAVDRLYGVTMQERGVSKRVSVRFDQVGSDGKIDATASTEPDADLIEEPEAPPSPTGSLRAALAGMRETETSDASA